MILLLYQLSYTATTEAWLSESPLSLPVPRAAAQESAPRASGIRASAGSRRGARL